MNPLFEDHIREVYSHFESGDHDLGVRRLTDCAIETQNTDIFKDTLAYYALLENKSQTSENGHREVAFALLEKIKNVGLPKVSQGNRTSEKILAVNSVSKQYAKSGFKINDLTFDLNDRQITGLVGENGNGKTTLLRLLAAELKPDRGEINYPFAGNKHDQYYLKTKLIYILSSAYPAGTAP